MGYRVLFVGLLCSSLILLGNLDRGPRGLAEDKESSDARFFGDSILDAMEGTSIGAELVPLAQVREEFTEAAPDGDISVLDRADVGTETGKLSLEALQDLAVRKEIAARIHPLVPGMGKPCTGQGLVVASVVTNGPADSAGIRRGDVIYLIGGKKVSTVADVEAALEKASKATNGDLKVGVATYDPNRTRGISETSPQAWKRQSVVVHPELKRYVLLDPLERTPDPVKGDDLYNHRDAVTLNPPMVMTLCFYRKVNSKPEGLSLTAQYHGKSWIFIDHLTVRADDAVFEFDLDPEDVTTSVAKDASVYEFFRFDLDNDEEHKKLLQAVLKAKKVLVRFSGSKGVKDIEAALSERAKMAELHTIYQKLRAE